MMCFKRGTNLIRRKLLMPLAFAGGGLFASGTWCHGVILRPDHIVVVIEQDRASDILTKPSMDYFRSLAANGLVYANSHGVAHPSLANSLALYAGQTYGEEGGGNSRANNVLVDTYNLGQSLFDYGHTFSGYVESLPANDDNVTQTAGTVPPQSDADLDLYTRNLNPMAMFPKPEGPGGALQLVNRTFAEFPTDYALLPTVSYVLPNNQHSTHGSNEGFPWAGAPDSQDDDNDGISDNDELRMAADDWLQGNLDGYLQWAKTHNSLLIVTQDEERWTGGTAQTVTTIVNGDPRLFVAGVNTDYVNHYNLLRTIMDMYAMHPFNEPAEKSAFLTNAVGQLVPTPEPTSLAVILCAGSMLLIRRARRRRQAAAVCVFGE